MATTRHSFALTGLYQRRLADLMARAGRIVAARWQQVPTAGEPAEDDFVAAVVPTLLGAQRTAAVMSDAYLARYLSLELRRPAPVKGLDLALLIGAAARGGTPPEIVYRRPFGVVRGLLASGVSFADAMAAGGGRAVQVATTDVALAARSARTQWMDGDDRIRGWQRVVAGGCALCTEAAGETYRSSDVMPIHPSCGCVTEPVVDGARGALLDRPTGKITDSPALEDDAADPDVPARDVVKIVEHGELGPVLYAAGDQFAA